MLERTPYTPKHEPASEAAKAYVPTFTWSDPNETDRISIREDFFGSRTKLRIGILGAGVTTINFLHYLEASIPAESVEVVVFEKNEDVGGVWQSSRYPGCRCDQPGVTYQFSWRPNVWKQYLPPAAESKKYVQTVTKERGFYRYVRLQHEVVRASWTDEEAKWTLTVKDLVNDRTFEEKFDVFMEFHGPVNSPIIPIKGIEDFKGQVIHTANWPKDLSLKDKRVALLGYGSTGVQVAPNIIDDVSKLYIWFRSKTYVMPPLAADFAAAEGANFKYSEEQIQQLSSDPDLYAAYVKAVQGTIAKLMKGNINGTPAAEGAKAFLLDYMKQKLSSRPDIFELLNPSDFDAACRRPVFNHGYLETLVHEKTTVLPKPPQSFTAKGLIDAEGKEHEIDLLIAATGYDQTHLPRYPHIVNGIDIRTKWEHLSSPPCYLSFCWDGMPNYYNPGSAYSAAYGSWHLVSEAVSKYLVQVISKMQLERITTLTVKPRAVQHFVRHANTFMERTAQAGPCNAWYKTKAGRPALWPGSQGHFFRVLERPRFEDFDAVYEDERDMFSFLGNGYTVDDAEEGGDVTWYLGQPGREVGEEEVERMKGVFGGELVLQGPMKMKQDGGIEGKL